MLYLASRHFSVRPVSIHPASTISSLVAALALILVAFVSAAPEARAQSGADTAGSPYVAPKINTNDAPTFAAYYAPYAMLANAAYYAISPNGSDPGLDALRGRAPVSVVIDDKGHTITVGADLDYAVTANDYGPLRPQALQILRHWHYRFGNDKYLTCLARYEKRYDQACEDAYRAAWYRTASGAPDFQVWTNGGGHRFGGCSQAAIAFRGTDVRADWISNFRQIFGLVTDDEYRQLARNVNTIMTKVENLGCSQIVSVGHSLGGGLAQFVALADRRVRKVFAFDSSPITGYSLVAENFRGVNVRGLEIDRVEQQGQVLSYLGLDQQYPGSALGCNPLVRSVEYDAFAPGPPQTSTYRRVYSARFPALYNSLELHSMPRLAARLVDWSQDSYGPNGEVIKIAAPPGNGCPVDFRDPRHPQPARGVLVSSLKGSRVTAAGSRRAVASAARQDNYGFTLGLASNAAAVPQQPAPFYTVAYTVTNEPGAAVSKTRRLNGRTTAVPPAGHRSRKVHTASS